MIWTRQPQGAVRVNWGSSLSRALAFCAPLNPGGGFQDIAGNQLGVRTGLGSQTVAPNGSYPLFGTGSYLDFSNNIAGVTGATPVTIAWTQTVRTPLSYSALLNWKPPGAANTFLIYQSASDSMYYFVAGPRGGTPVSFSAVVGTQVDGRTDRYALVMSSGVAGAAASFALFANGSKLTTAATQGFGANTDAAFRIGARDAGSDPFEGGVGNFHIWTRALSDAEGAIWSTPGGEFSCYAPSRRVWAQLGAAAGGGADTTVAPSKGALVATGYAPAIVRKANQTVAPTLGHAVIAGRTPGVSQTVVTTVAPTLAHATITGRQPGVVRTDNQAVAPSLARATVTGRAPGIEQDIGVAPTIAHLTATGRQPGITQNVTSFIAPSKGALTATGKQPAVQQTASQTIAPSKGVAYLAGYAPVVEIAGGSQILLPSKGVLTLTGYAPEVSTGGELGGKPVFARRRKRYLVKDRVYDDLDPADVIAAAKEAGVDLGDVREVVKEPTAQKSRPRRADDDGREYWLPQEFWGRAAARQKLEATAPLGEDFQRAVEALRASAGPLQARMALRRRQEEEAIILLMA
jgi:hypothetical protein